MSMYQNSSYMQAPPPVSAPTAATTTTAQNSMINGMPPPPQSNATMQPTLQQQQQQILQQKQQMQQQQSHQQQLFSSGSAIPTTLNSANMSKFLPPPMTMAPPTSFASTQPPTTAAAPTPTTALNGPNSLPPPAQLRPPGGMNGVPLTNGGLSEASAHSSRTASPALQAGMPTATMAPPSMQQQQQVSRAPMMSTQPTPQISTFQRQTMAPGMATTTTATSSIGALSGGMQNLNLSRQNGPGMPPPQRQSFMPPSSVAPIAPPSNFQRNFQTTALNAAQPQSLPPPPSSTSSTSSALLTSTIPQSSLPPISFPLTSTAPPAQQLNRQMPPPMGVSQPPQPSLTSSLAAKQQTLPPATAFGPSATMPPPPISRPTLSQQNANYANAPPAMQAPPPIATAATFQQNQLNNNNQQQQQSQQHLHAMQRRPMYPSAGQLPPMPPLQASNTTTQMQQPYAQAYQQQQQQQQPPLTTQPGMFNGQPSTGPLQYQSQTNLPPQQQQQQQYNPQMSVTQQGFNRLWGQDTIDLMQNRHILSPNTLMPPKIVLHNQFHESINCNPNIMRCTIAKIPESNSLLQKSRLPLGIVIHPFRDINSLPVIQCPNIVRCRLCRTYINPFVYFVDSKMWKCNLCYRTNELPEDFQFDPATKTYGDVTRRPEVRSSTIEFIAPSEYMLRPPQPAIYLFLFDVSIIAQQSGYLENVCAVLNKHLDDMPGDARTQVGFIAYNSEVHFYSMAEGYNQPHEMTLLDIDDPFLPRPDNLLVNLKECKELVKDLLTQLPKRFADTHDPGSALGAALQVAYKLMQASGGRVTVFQTCLPNKGPGALEPREDPNNRSAKDVAHLNPATDFYKRYALECSGYQIAVDLFLMNQQYSDLATISGISKHSGGCVHHFPLYQKTKPQHVDSFKQCFKRYLTRKIGFEAVMRIRCTRGLQVHTFHGNFFVRSTDLLSLPNVNPDAGYGMQISYEENLSDVKTICFQAALLYTNSEGERRIRVHTLCLPVTASLPEVMHAADPEAIIGLLSKMAVDRSLTSNVADAREAFLNATVDIFNAFKIAQNLPSGQSGQLIAPRSLALLPLYILALLKHRAFRVGTSTRLDDRVFAMDCMKTLPLDQLMKNIYPELYQIDTLFYNTQNPNPNAHTNSNSTEDDDDDDYLPEVMRLQLSAEFLDSRSTFLLDCGTLIIVYVGMNVPADVLEKAFGIKSTAELPDYCYGLPNVNSKENDALRRFIMRLNEDKPYAPTVQIIRDTSTAKPEFIEKLVDDRSESSLSYYEFLQHIRSQVK